MNSFLGRCPACAQLVSLPAEARDREVACPACQHRARGVEFGAIEAPPAVLLMPQAPVAERRRAPLAPARSAAPPRRPADDEAQTHLLLDLPCEEEDATDAGSSAIEAKTRLLRRTPPTVQAQRAHAADEERTHLLLDAAEWADEPDVEGEVSDHERTRVRLDGGHAVGAEERTRLQLGPLSLRTGDHSPLARLVSGLGRLVPALLRLSVWLEEALQGREGALLGAIALVCGLVAPGLDYSATGSTLGGFSLLFQLLALALLGVWQLNGLRDDDGKWDPRVAVTRADATVRLSIESLEQLAASPRHLQWRLVSQLLGLVGLVGLGWASFLEVAWWIVGLPTGFSTLPFLNGLALLGAVLVGRHAQRLAPTPRFSLHELGNAVAAVAALPSVVDLADPLPDTIAAGSTTLHQCLVALAGWKPREWPTEAAYRAALERHLQRHLTGLRVERERWLGSSRIDGSIDLVVDGMIVLGVQRGTGTAALQRTLANLRRWARAWSGKPMILVLFAASGEASVEASSATAWNQLREECALVTVRMPSY